jgi:glycosyltransferase involved in cell wall biosynthesis
VTRFLFITVAEDSPESIAHMRQLLESIGRQQVAADMVLVVRGASELDLPVPPGLRLHTVAQPRRVSLSHARNRALARARASGLLAAADAVAFPDDDCRYPDGLLARVGAALSAGGDIVCGPYGPRGGAVDRGRFIDRAAVLRPSLVMRVIASGSVFFARRVVEHVGDFDERFGLGARYGASEDSDYVITALAAGFAGRYLPDLIIEHPYKGHRPAQYYVGNVAVLAKHVRGPRSLASLLYRLATGVRLTLRGAIPASVLMRAMVSAGQMLIFEPGGPGARGR